MPASVGSPTLPSVRPHRPLQGNRRPRPDQDVPGQGGQPNKELADKWTWDFFLEAAEKCFKAGHPFGLPTRPHRRLGRLDRPGLSQPRRRAGRQGRQHHRQVRRDQAGARVVQEAGAVLDARTMPSPGMTRRNNKSLISGQAALIFNPPSAWAVAVRDAPKVAEQCWTLPVAERARRAASTRRSAVLLGHLEVLARTRRRRRASLHLSVPDAPRSSRLVAGEPGLRHPALRRVARLQDLGRRGSAKGHASTTIRRAATSSRW